MSTGSKGETISGGATDTLGLMWREGSVEFSLSELPDQQNPSSSPKIAGADAGG